MLKRILGVWLVAIILSLGGVSMAAELVVLPNGLKVLVQEDNRFPLVSVRLFVRTGSAYEDPKQAGISHLLEHMVFKGTEKRKTGEIAEAIESKGGYLNAATSFDYTVYVMDMPAKHWELALEVLEDMIFHSRFDEQELEKEKNVVLAELERGEDNPGQKLFKTIQAKLFQGSPYARPIIGFVDSVKSITARDLKNYIQEHYQPLNMLLVVCGKIKKDEVVKAAQKYFGKLENRKSEVLFSPQPLDQPVKPVVEVVQGPWKKVYVDIGFPAPSMHSKDALALEVLAYLLGGDKTSYFYRLLKYEKGLVDDVSSSSLLLDKRGAFYFSVSLDPDKVDSFWSTFLQHLQHLDWSLLDEVRLKQAKLNLENDLLQAKETLGGIASKLGYFQFFEGSFLAENAYLQALQGITLEDLKKVYQTYLQPERLVAAFLLPKEVNLTADYFLSKIKVSPAVTPKAVSARGRNQRVLDLGLGRMLVVEQDSTLPYTALNISWKGGDSLLTPEEAGLAVLTAKALLRGTSKRSFLEIQDFLALRTSDLEAEVGRKSFSLKAKFPSKYSEDIYALLEEIILEPSFLAEEVEKSKLEQIAEIKEKKDSPVGLLFRELFPFLFKSGPYSFYHLGQEDRVARFSVEQVKEFWEKQKQYPFIISVCGDVSEKELDNFVQKIREKLRPSQKIEDSFLWTREKELVLNLPERNQSHLLLVFPVQGLKSTDTPGLTVLNRMLSGQSGLLFQRLRDEQGLGYSVTSFLWQSSKTGFLAFYIGTYQGEEDKALEGFKDVIAQLKQGQFREEEVIRAKNVYEGSYYRNLQSLGSRASEKAELWLQDLNFDFKEKMIQEVNKVSKEDIVQAASTYLDFSKAYLLEIKP